MDIDEMINRLESREPLSDENPIQESSKGLPEVLESIDKDRVMQHHIGISNVLVRLSNVVSWLAGLAMGGWIVFLVGSYFKLGGMGGLIEAVKASRPEEVFLVPAIWLAAGIFSYLLVGQFRMFLDTNRAFAEQL